MALLVLSMVVFMAEPGEGIWATLFHGVIQGTVTLS